MYKKILFIIAVMSLICFNISVYNAAEDDPLKKIISSDNPTDNDFKNFEKLSDENKNKYWENLGINEKKVFLEKYMKYKIKKDIEIIVDGENLDLKWKKNSIYYSNNEKKASVNFDSLRETLKSVKFDDVKKTITYEFERNKINNRIEIDDGYIDKDGNIKIGRSLVSRSSTSTTEEKILGNVIYGEGYMKYENGRFVIPADENKKNLIIGNNVYLKPDFGLKEDTIIIPPLENEPAKAFNARVLLFKESTDKTAYGVLEIGMGKKDNKEIFVSIFDKAPPENFNEPYVYINPKESIAKLNDNNKGSYIQLEVFSDFKKIEGKGSQVWLKNNEALISFHEGKVNMYNGQDGGVYEIHSIVGSDDKNKEFMFIKNKDYLSAEFFDKDFAVVRTGLLVSETSGMLVVGPLGRVRGGQVSTQGYYLEYSKEYSPEYFKGSEEERLAAIARDPRTKVVFQGPGNINLPGQLVASEILKELEYNNAVAILQAGEGSIQERSAKLKWDKENLGNLIRNRGSISATVLDSFIPGLGTKNNPFTGNIYENEEIYGKVIKAISDEKKVSIDEAKKILDSYIISTNYIPGDFSSNAPSVNRLLYELSTKYYGEVYIPERASLRARPSSYGGISTLEFRSDGIYVDGNKIEGIKPEVAKAFRNLQADHILNFDRDVSRRLYYNNWYSYQGGNWINDAGYPFDVNDFQKYRNEGGAVFSGIIGARGVGQGVLDEKRYDYYKRLAEYQDYCKNKRLPCVIPYSN